MVGFSKTYSKISNSFSVSTFNSWNVYYSWKCDQILRIFVFLGIFQMTQKEEIVKQKLDFVLEEHEMIGGLSRTYSKNSNN